MEYVKEEVIEQGTTKQATKQTTEQAAGQVANPVPRRELISGPDGCLEYVEVYR